jgi:O-antigen/teichoic acid export membrane protein
MTVETVPEAKKRPSRLLPVANVTVAQINMALSTAGSFLVTPAMLAGLGDDHYGGWLLINSFISYMRFLDLGTSAGTVKYGAGALERGDEGDLRKVLNSTSAIFATVGTLALIGSIGLAFVLPRVYPTIAGDQSGTILMLGAALAFDLYTRIFAASLRIRSLFFVYDTVEVVAFLIFKLGLLLYFAYRDGLSYTLLAILTLAETIFRNGIIVGAAMFLSPFVRRLNPFAPARDMIAKLTKMGIAMSLIHVADILRFQVDSGVIGYFMPESPVSISIFGVGTRLASIAYTAIGVIGAVLMPRFSGLSETGDKKGVKSLLQNSSLATGLTSSLVLVNIAVLGPHFLELWLKKPWVPTSGNILLIMLPAYYVALLSGPSAGLLVGRGQLRGLTVITIGEAVFNFVLSVALVKPFGIYGVAIGTVIPMIVVRGVLFPLLLKKEIGLLPSEYVRMHARPVLLGLVYLVLVGGLAFVPLVSYARFLALGAASVVVFFVLLVVAVPEARAALPKVMAKLPGRRQ